MAKSFLRLFGSAYNIQRQKGSKELLKQSFNYARTYNKDHLDLECNGVNVRFDTSTRVSKDWFFPRYLDGTLHEPKITKELIESLSSDSTFYDIGANIGYYTVFASEVCDNGEVHAFELDPKFIRLIRNSLGLNNSDAKLNNNAISDDTGAKITYSGEFGKTSVDKTSKKSSQQVESIAIDDYIQENKKPDVMKVDIEGFELYALRGAEQLLEQGFPKKLFLEIHPPKIRHYGGNVQNILTILESYGYEYTSIANHRDQDSNTETLREDEITEVDNMMLLCEV